MVHGFLGAKQNFASAARAIAAATGRAVHTLDMRNHGSSPWAAPHTYPAMARDTIQFIKLLRQPVSIVGHSMGAKVAMLVGLTAPEMVEKLVVVDNAPALQQLEDQFTNHLIGLCHVERSDIPVKPRMLAVERAMQLLEKFEPDAQVRTFLAANVVPRATKVRVPVLNLLKDDALGAMGEWPETGARFHGPVLVIKAQHSCFIGAHHAKQFRRYFDNVHFSIYDCGHWVVSEQAEKFNSEVAAFLG